jgi:hypothetical protein
MRTESELCKIADDVLYSQAVSGWKRVIEEHERASAERNQRENVCHIVSERYTCLNL